MEEGQQGVPCGLSSSLGLEWRSHCWVGVDLHSLQEIRVCEIRKPAAPGALGIPTLMGSSSSLSTWRLRNGQYPSPPELRPLLRTSQISRRKMLCRPRHTPALYGQTSGRNYSASGIPCGCQENRYWAWIGAFLSAIPLESPYLQLRQGSSPCAMDACVFCWCVIS